MNNLLSYCGLVDARISASEKDLPVRKAHFNRPNMILNYCTVIMTTIYIAQYQNKTFLSSQWPSMYSKLKSLLLKSHWNQMFNFSQFTV